MQPTYVQVWSEKSTVGGVLRPVLREYGVPFRVIHGFSSVSALHEASEESAADHRPWKILYCGDHDPSGMFISEVDIQDGLARYQGQATIHRVALTADDLPGLPPNKPNTGDQRWRWYCEHYGETCWELDAMDPGTLRTHVEEAIKGSIDWPAWRASQRVERAELRKIQALARSLR